MAPCCLLQPSHHPKLPTTAIPSLYRQRQAIGPTCYCHRTGNRTRTSGGLHATATANVPPLHHQRQATTNSCATAMTSPLLPLHRQLQLNHQEAACYCHDQPATATAPAAAAESAGGCGGCSAGHAPGPPHCRAQRPPSHPAAGPPASPWTHPHSRPVPRPHMPPRHAVAMAHCHAELRHEGAHGCMLVLVHEADRRVTEAGHVVPLA